MTDTPEIERQPTPVCPHCGHVMNTDEMQNDYGHSVDLFALAPMEDTAVIKCPVCDEEYCVKGGYTPHYTSAFTEDEL